MQNQEPATSKLILLVILPPLIAGLMVFALLFTEFSHRSASQQQHFGNATAKQLSHYLAPYVVEGNLLSLNVVVGQLANDDYIHSVAVYDDANALIAQSGKSSGGSKTYTNEITFQDSVVGLVRVAVRNESAPSPYWAVALLLFLLPLMLLAWKYPTVITAWLFASQADSTKEEPRPPEEMMESTTSEDEEESMECILVIRIRAAHHMEKNFDKFFNAAQIYGGVVEQTTPEELVVHFDDQDAMFNAASTGLLVRELADLLPGNIKFGATLGVLGEEPDKARKSASYLASIADGDLLIAGGEEMIGNRAMVQTFHHSLVDSEDLCRVTSLTNQTLIDGQAKQLL